MTYMPAWIASVLALIVLVQAGDAQEVRCQTDYNAARAQAKQQQRPLIIDFGTVNCTWCKRFDDSTLRDPAIGKLLSEHFVFLRIDANRDAPLAQMLGINSFPTLVFAAPDGKILGKHVGFVDVQRFTRQLDRAMKESQTP